MKNHILLFLLSFSCICTAQKNIFESDRFDELSETHQTLAILPFIAHLDLKNNSTPEELNEQEAKEGYAVQDALETYFSRGKKRKKFTVNFQNTKNTNALLAQHNITYDNIDVYTMKELAAILQVDGIVSGSLDLNILLSKGVSSSFSLLDYFNGKANYGRIGIKISDGTTGKLLWKYEHAIDKKTGKNTTSFIDNMMKKATRKFPYDKEKIKK